MASLSFPHSAAQDSPFGRGRVSLAASLSFIATMAVLWAASGDTTLAVYALSFWHYCLYVFAFAYRSVGMGDFRRDALLMRTVALIALGAVYLAEPFHPISLAVAAAGFLLNAAAVRALGTEGTYYGVELGELTPRRITTFPYSVMSHPMLIGNMLAFTGLLLNPAFRRDWWPLAAAHVLLNGAVILMEAYGRPLAPADRRAMTLGTFLARTFLCAVIGGFFAAVGGKASPVFVLAGACIAAYANALFECYSATTVADAVISPNPPRSPTGATLSAT